MSKKTKTPKFNSVLEDFRKFAGLKQAEEQGDKEQSVSYIPSEEDVKKQLPAGGKPFGSNVDPNANKGTAQGEKAPDTKEPKTEEESTQETSASSKVASEDEELVNTLLQSINLVVNEEKVATEVKEETKEEGKEVPVTATPDMPDEDKKAEEATTVEEPAKEEAVVEEPAKEEAVVEPAKEEVKEASANEINEDVLAAKIASHFRNVSVGYELGKFIFATLGQKVAGEGEMPASAEVPPDVAAGMEAGGAPSAEGGNEGDEVAMILQAVQELVQEGQISEEQAQQFLTELQSAVQGGGEGAAPEGAVAPEGAAPEGAAHEAAESPAKEESEKKEEPAEEKAEDEKKEAMVAAVNAKVAELAAEGKTDAEIEAYLKEAAANDAAAIVKQAKDQQDAVVKDYVYNKVASAIDQGATDDQVNEYIKFAQENPEAVVEEINTLVQIQEAVETKVAELKAAGKTETEIEAFLKEAAENDAKMIKQDNLKAAILNKVAAAREEKVAAGEELPPEAAAAVDGGGSPAAGPDAAGGEGGMPPEMQEILQALEQLLQSGQITEEEAMAVLKELGIGGEGAAPEGAAPAPEAAPVAA